jgi:hypothetical protein
VKGTHAAERAAIFLSIVAGFQMNRQMLQLDALAEADPAVLIELMTRVFEAVIGPADRR